LDYPVTASPDIFPAGILPLHPFDYSSFITPLPSFTSVGILYALDALEKSRSDKPTIVITRMRPLKNVQFQKQHPVHKLPSESITDK